MSISVEARVWLATHLLFPNSTQAFDVYQAIVSQSDRAIQNNDLQNLLKKISAICEKIPPISSSLSFHVFENKPMGEWPLIYKKTQRIQQLIFVGVLIFDLSIEEISKIYKLSHDKTRFLFHQAFKKVIDQRNEVKTAYDFKFKKSADKSVSYLFTNENLIDYSLGLLTQAEVKKVKLGLETYPTLQHSAKVYETIIKEVKNLVTNHESFLIVVPNVKKASKQKPTQNFKTTLIAVNRYKKPISVSTISAIALLIIFIRPRWIENFSDGAKNEAIVLLELKKSQIQIEENKKLPISLNELPIQNKEKNKPVTVAAPEAKPLAVAEEKAASRPATISEPKKQGGLYRGVLYVTDLAEVTPKLVDKIVGFGGKKAGEVELGWRKNEKLGYYHFTLPQDNVVAVNEFIAMFGQYKVEFENHPRLVAPGLKRFIIEVKEND